MDKIKSWLQTTPYKDFEITIVSADASFREYHRLTKNDESVLLMDSSLEKESLKPFLDVTAKLLACGVKAPQILEQNLEDGFLIIEDFGDTHYLDILSWDNFKELYKKAIDEIVKMQNADISNLPLYDKKFLTFEMDLMAEWYMKKLLPVTLSQKQKDIINDAVDKISDVVLSQPQNLFVHRDFHSCNLIKTNGGRIGIIDFQDAVLGPVSYDLVSLIWDRYIAWPRAQIESWIEEFRLQLGLDLGPEQWLPVAGRLWR